jgi:hypothetical protein
MRETESRLKYTRDEPPNIALTSVDFHWKANCRCWETLPSLWATLLLFVFARGMQEQPLDRASPNNG